MKLRTASNNVERCIKLQSGRVVHYRLNKGDIWSMREVLLDECYRFPGDISPAVVVDLGGNIGLTSLWLDSQFQLQKIVVLEPLPSNARIARKNLAQTSADVKLIEAAAGSEDGMANFVQDIDSNRGSVAFGTAGKTRVVSMGTLIQEAGITGGIDLLKVDIEGGEAELFSKNLDWLSEVRSIIAEFHPDIAQVDPIVRTICAQGFRHIAPGSVFPYNMEAFVRIGSPKNGLIDS
ncbi:MAG: FkbM family methyltransferase [Prosthecobacter sp.]